MLFEAMERNLANKKQELSQRQKSFKIGIENDRMNDINYERNAINDLLVMEKLKTEIEQIEFYLQYKNFEKGNDKNV